MSNYRVGYGKPPKNGQFKKGKSGNPGGRPKKKKPADPELDILDILRAPVAVRVNGETRYMDPQEAIFRQLLKSAINEGHRPSTRRLIKDLIAFGFLENTAALVTHGTILMPTRWDREEWLQMLKKHGLPPWPGDDDGCADIDRPRLLKHKAALEKMQRRGS